MRFLKFFFSSTLLSLLPAIVLFTTIHANPAEQLQNENPELTLGERTKGAAKMYDAPGGTVLFILQDDTPVEIIDQDNDWYIAGIPVRLTPEQQKLHKLFPGAPIYSLEGKKIGTASEEVDVWMFGDEIGVLNAYAHANTIKQKTIVENVLADLLNQGKTKVNDFATFLKNYGFQEFSEEDPLIAKEYYIYDGFLSDPSPVNRVTLLFDANDNLLGIVHSRALNTPKLSVHLLQNGHRLTIAAKLKDREVQELINAGNAFYDTDN